MARPEKVAVVDEVSESLSGTAATVLTDYRGLTVTELAELRARLREANATYKVVKNTLTKRAADAAGIEGLDQFLAGPTALVFCEDDPVAPMKALRDFMKDHPELLVKAGWVEGEVLDDQATMKLAELESREELLAKLAGLFYGALANFARLLQAPIEHQARLLKALEDAGGPEAKGFEVEGAAAAAAPEAAGSAAEEAPAVEDAEEPAAETADEPEAAAADEAEEPAAEEPEAAADEVEDPAAEEPDAEEPAAEEADEPEAESDDEPEAAADEDDEATS